MGSQLCLMTFKKSELFKQTVLHHKAVRVPFDSPDISIIPGYPGMTQEFLLKFYSNEHQTLIIYNVPLPKKIFNDFVKCLFRLSLSVSIYA